MKKFYVLVVCLCTTIFLNAQTWIGGSTGNWNNTANWSGATIPNAVGANVIFNSNATVAVDIPSMNLGTLTVTNNATVKLVTTVNTSITLNSTSTSSRALQIDLGSRLEDSADVNNTLFNVIFANNAKGRVAGTWYFSGVAGSPGGRATFSLPTTTGLTNVVDVDGLMKFAGAAVPPPNIPVEAYLSFNNNSTFWLDAANKSTPLAAWNANSTIKLTGIGSNVNTNTTQVGHLTIDIPTLDRNVNLALPNNLTVLGNLSILNTKDFIVGIATSPVAGPISYTVNGNMTVSGTSNVVFVNSNTDVDNYTLDVKGDFNMSGTSFLLRSASSTTLAYPAILKIGKTLNHTAGTFGNNASTTSTTTELYVVELDGTLNQNITSTPGTIDDAQNQVTLRLNNPSGATLMTPLAVGKISWSSTNKGILATTSTNILTINNARDSVADPLVVKAPGTGGFVNGPVRRKVGTIGGYNFPTGNASTYRPIVISPAVTTAGAFDAQYFGSGYPNLTVQAPLSGVSNSEYWNAVLAPSSPVVNATIQISLNGTAVSGANSSQSLVVAAYGGSGTGWVNAAGSQLSPATSTTGSVISKTLSAFGPFTFGYGVIGALPIHLLSFDAKKISASAAAISWAITSNSTPSYFEVLKSADGSHFTKAGIVASTHFVYNYNFTDNNLPAGTTYYRLNMVDQNGSTTLSKIVAVVNSAKGVVMSSMLPTVVTGSARINISSSQNLTLQLVVTDMNGRVMQRQLAGITAGANQEVRLDLQSLAAGAYQVTGYAAGELIGTIRFIKQ